MEHVLSDEYHSISGGCGFLPDDDTERGFGLCGFMRIDDARLIAAAPELLAALIRVERVARGYTPSAQRELRLDDIRAAIAKATGSAV